MEQLGTDDLPCISWTEENSENGQKKQNLRFFIAHAADPQTRNWCLANAVYSALTLRIFPSKTSEALENESLSNKLLGSFLESFIIGFRMEFGEIDVLEFTELDQIVLTLLYKSNLDKTAGRKEVKAELKRMLSHQPFD
ncbi:hypothetical protein DFP90_102399 [Aestuariispira insulae]|uniref:Uncharacterized protein n=2 Tax=Aestuariispira insulae TaxID=1461337 RepID=A0A3D9HS95_9PROT|nr:hypothetical protein DFP90_102399 [Aestuariispira insulae]